MMQCCFCSFESVQKKTVERIGKEAVTRYDHCDNGLQCTKCSKFACMYCLLEIVSIFSKSCRKKDRWCRRVFKYLFKGIYPNNFIGNCCELSEKRRKLLLRKPPPPIETRYDGHLYLPQFSILIDSPMDCVDLHALGGNGTLQAAWHCVVSHKAAERFERENLKPNGKDALFDEATIIEVEVPSPYSKGDKIKFKVRIRTAFQTQLFDEERAGRNDPCPEELKGCHVVSSEDPSRGDVDIDIITGRFADNTDSDSLLLFRVYDFKKKLEKKDMWPNNNTLQSFHKLCLTELCKNKGYEVKRHGGSSGMPKFDATLFNFIHRHCSFPRRGKGVKFVKVRRNWRCVYIRVQRKPGKFAAAQFTYSPPKRGGQFKVSGKVLQQFPFLFDYAETKIFAAPVLRELNNDAARVPIQKNAVLYELNVLKTSMDAASCYSNNTGGLHDDSKEQLRRLLIENFVSQNQHTLVQHPVGFHRDIFKKGKECLENKFCFVVHGNHGDDRMGRGGAGYMKFVVAILDWAG